MKKTLAVVCIAGLLAGLVACAGSSGGSGYRRVGGYSTFGYGYRGWGGCGFGCRPPVIIAPGPEQPVPELPYEPPEFEATPLPSMDMDMDFGEW